MSAEDREDDFEFATDGNWADSFDSAHELAEQIRDRDVPYLGQYHSGWLDAADSIDPEVGEDD